MKILVNAYTHKSEFHSNNNSCFRIVGMRLSNFKRLPPNFCFFRRILNKRLFENAN